MIHIYSLKKLSLSHRLTLLYLVSIIITFIIVYIFLYRGIDNILNKANEQFLIDEIHFIQKIMNDQPNNFNLLRQEANWIPKYIRNKTFNKIQNNIKKWIVPYDYIRILDHSSKTLLSTPGMENSIPKNVFSKLPLKDCSISPSKIWHSPLDHVYLLISANAKCSKNLETSQYIQIALDITSLSKVTKTYQQLLLIVILIGTFLAAISGHLVTRRGMQALKDMTETTKKITIKQLSQRLVPKHWPLELRQLAIAFNRMLNRIEKSYNRLSQFSADLAHELRTPINNLMIESEVTLSRKRSLPEYENLLSSNLEEYNRLSRLIDRLLFLARADNPHTFIEKTIFNVAAEFQAIYEFFNIIAEEKNIKLILEGDATIQADKTLFRQAINNLLNNSFNHTPSGGEIYLSAKISNDFININVEDTGKGIPADKKLFIFDRFYRHQTDNFKQPKGTGLGLSIVKMIMKLHHGHINVESQPDKGTKVTLSFPK